MSRRRMGLALAGRVCRLGSWPRAWRMPPTSRFWTWRQEDKAAYNELFADFTKANPGHHM